MLGSSRVRFLQGQGEQFHLGPLDIGGNLSEGHSALMRISFPGTILAGSCKPVEHPAADIVDDPLELDELALRAEMGAALIPRVGGEEGAVGSQDFIGEETQQLGDLHQDMEDLVVELLSQPLLEIGEGGFTGQMGRPDSGIQPIMLSFVAIADGRHEAFHVRDFSR